MEGLISNINLDKNIPIPLYYQLKRQVLSMIEASTLQEGDMLPPESELCVLLNVSRPTIRQAFNELVSEGYLNRYKGKGTFVSKPKVEERFLSKLETFDAEMRAKSMKPSTQVLELAKITNPHEAHEKLELSLESPIIYLSRLRFADNIPLVYVETYLSYEKYPQLMNVNFNEKSLYDSLEELCQVRVTRASREIEAVNSRRKEAELLKISVNKAVSLVKTLAYSTGLSHPIEFSVARYRGDLNKFSVDIYR